jgi:hypothetical protein
MLPIVSYRHRSRCDEARPAALEKRDALVIVVAAALMLAHGRRGRIRCARQPGYRHDGFLRGERNRRASENVAPVVRRRVIRMSRMPGTVILDARSRQCTICCTFAAPST